MFTTHGHQIIGTIAEPRPIGMSVARCGGPTRCEQCAREATSATKEQSPYNANGDMVTRAGQVFRQVGWQINGGPDDGVLIVPENPDDLKNALVAPHGGYSPVYVEVGMD